MFGIFRTPRHYPALILAASAGVLLTAFGFQHIGGLDPCVLCIRQRYPYVATILLSLLAMGLTNARARGGLLALCGVIFLVGGGIAAFHVGVEQHWWQGTAECTGAVAQGLSLADVLAQAEAGPGARCDDIPWSLFGISMAGYNLLLSLALAAASLYGARRLIVAPRVAEGAA